MFFKAHLDDVVGFFYSKCKFWDYGHDHLKQFCFGVPGVFLVEWFKVLYGEFIFMCWWCKLLFLLNQERKHFVDWWKWPHKHDTGANHWILLAKAFQETNDIIVFLILFDGMEKCTHIFDGAKTWRYWTKILQLFPQFFQCCEILGDRWITLPEGEDFFLEIWNPKNTTLMVVIL